MTIVAYVRSSVNVGHSVETQIRECRQLAERLGDKLVDENIYQDLNHDGIHEDRPGLTRLQGDLSDRKISRCYVYSPSRLSRLSDGCMKLIGLMLDKGVKVMFVHEDGGKTPSDLDQ